MLQKRKEKKKEKEKVSSETLFFKTEYVYFLPCMLFVASKVFCDLEDRMQLHCPSIFAMLFDSPKGIIAVQGGVTSL